MRVIARLGWKKEKKVKKKKSSSVTHLYLS